MNIHNNIYYYIVVADNRISFILFIIISILFFNSEKRCSDVSIKYFFINSLSVDDFQDFIIPWDTTILAEDKLVADSNQLLNLDVNC